ncbi:MAG: 3-oxoacyl-ACP reductase family protein [Verrucomicrobiota bacterium]
MNLNLQGKVALVTGGSRGIGAAICRAFAAEGVRVGFNYHSNPEAAEELVTQLRGHGVEAAAVSADLGEEASVLNLIDRVAADLGPINILVNNAAVCPSGPMESYSWDVWQHTLDVNVTGAFVACRELASSWRQHQTRGKIINIVSQAAFLGSTSGHLPYDSSKGALLSMTRALARELGPEGINVNAVAPGMVKTEMVIKKLEAKLDFYLSRIPLKRIAEPEEIANIVIFLASEAASYITGATIDASGGVMMH